MPIEASSTMTDKELLRLGARANGQREKAWRILYRRLKPAIMGHLQGEYKMQESVAEDLVQDTFERLLRHAHRYDASRASVWSWTTTIASNLAKNVFRSRSRDPTERYEVIDAAGERNDSPWVEMNTDPARTPNPEADLARSEAREAVEDALEQLQPIHRAPMRLRLRGFSYEEIARQTGIRLGTVKSRLARGRERMRQELRSRGVNPEQVR